MRRHAAKFLAFRVHIIDMAQTPRSFDAHSQKRGQWLATIVKERWCFRRSVKLDALDERVKPLPQMKVTKNKRQVIYDNKQFNKVDRVLIIWGKKGGTF